jgi:hypothetical protein
MNSVSQRLGGLVNISRKQLAFYVVPAVLIGLVMASQASATTTCATSVLTLVSSELVSGSGGSLGCSVNSTPGLTFYTTGPINSVLSEQNVPTFKAIWTAAYTGPGPASTNVAYDVLIAGTAGQPVAWALEVQPPSGPLVPIAGGNFTIALSGISEFTNNQAVSPIVPGNYTVELTASSDASFSVNAPANSSVDVANPTPNGTVPEPASVATLGIGLAAGFLFFGKLRKKNRN